jgi:hypothetical protein
MKKINFVFLLLISLTSCSQNIKKTRIAVAEIFISIPDSVFSDNIFEIPKEERQLFWEQYKKGEYRNIEMSTDKVVGELDWFFENDFIRRALVDEKNGLVRIMGPSDTNPVFEIKAFVHSKTNIIAITLKYYDFATDVSKKVIFYEFRDHKFINITEEVLSSFNYKKDNYSDTTIKLVSTIYGHDVISNPFNNKLLYRFTCSDTVYITESFFGIDEDLSLDKKYFDGEFFSKKYIMKRGKLKLAE